MISFFVRDRIALHLKASYKEIIVRDIYVVLFHFHLIVRRFRFYLKQGSYPKRESNFIDFPQMIVKNTYLLPDPSFYIFANIGKKWILTDRLCTYTCYSTMQNDKVHNC